MGTICDIHDWGLWENVCGDSLAPYISQDRLHSKVLCLLNIAITGEYVD